MPFQKCQDFGDTILGFCVEAEGFDVSEKQCSCRARDEVASNWHGITGNSKCGVESIWVFPVKTVPNRIAKAEKQSHEV